MEKSAASELDVYGVGELEGMVGCGGRVQSFMIVYGRQPVLMKVLKTFDPATSLTF